MIRFGRVVAFYEGRRTCDIVDTADGARYLRVPVMAGSVSSDTGQLDIPPMQRPSGEADIGREDGRVMIAVLAFYGGVPVILGFVAPISAQVMFDEAGRYIHRLGSDVYATCDDSGNLELYHPSGTYVRIGEDPAHEDLTGKDVNRRWKIIRNTGRSPHLRLEVAAGGKTSSSVDMDPAGVVTVKAATVVLDADVKVTKSLTAGSVSDSSGSMQDMRDIYNAHTHAETGGVTAPPTPTQ